MKFVLATLTVLWCATLGSAAALPTTCNAGAIPRDSCAYYDDCLEATYPCGADGYAVGYGGKFCRAFSGNASHFSDQGKRWISDVMLCLQTELVPLVARATQPAVAAPSCKAIKTFAFDSHPKCYVDSGVCALPLSDYIELVKVIGLKQLLADFESIKQSATVSVECLGKWTKAIFHARQLQG